MSRKLKGLITQIGPILAVLAVVIGLLNIGPVFFVMTILIDRVSSSSNKTLIAGDLPEPDKSFFTGADAGTSVYIWECYQNNRIAVYTYRSMFTVGPFKREEVACGELTGVEKYFADKWKTETGQGGFWH